MFIKPPFDEQITFHDGVERWVRNIIHIERGEWYHLMTKDGVEYIFPPANIKFIRVYKTGKAPTCEEQIGFTNKLTKKNERHN
jgi:hypothetical protein